MKSVLIAKIEVSNRQQALERLRENPVHAKEAVYLDRGEGGILMLVFANSARELWSELESQAQRSRDGALKDLMTSDWSRQVLEYVTSAKSGGVPLEESRFVQLRYIEVPRRVYGEYSDWRENTIFAHVRGQKEIESFHAYHTVVSTEPGVMFLAGFSCSEDEYRRCFENPHYQAIVKEAGSRFIRDGVNGLYTRIYQRA